jgi:hypothetical protein
VCHGWCLCLASGLSDRAVLSLERLARFARRETGPWGPRSQGVASWTGVIARHGLVRRLMC